MSILALDLGTHTGVARGVPGERPSLCTWDMPAGGGEDVGPFMAAFIDRLENVLDVEDQLGSDSLIIFEAPYVAVRTPPGGRPFVQRDQVARAFGMQGILEGFAHKRGIPIFSVVTVTLKKSFAGNGRAEKLDMIRMARRLGFDPANDHEADALACWVHAVKLQWPEHAAAYDPLFAGARA